MLPLFSAALSVGSLVPLVGALVLAWDQSPPAAEPSPTADDPADTTIPFGGSEQDEDTKAALRRRDVAAEAFAEGVRFFEVGDYDMAMAAFSAADDLVPHPYTRFNLGLAQLAAGQTLQAWSTLHSVEVQTTDPRERSDVQAQLRQLEKEVAVLRVRATPGAALCIDGVGVEPDHLGDYTAALWPGPHRLGVDGYPVDVTLEAGEPTIMHLEQASGLLERRTPPQVPPLVGVATGSALASVGLGIGALVAREDPARRGLGGAAVGTAALAGATGLAAFLLMDRSGGKARRARQRQNPDSREPGAPNAPVDDGCPPPPPLELAPHDETESAVPVDGSRD